MSENLLKEICNKVLSLFKQTEKEEENAKDVACNRLRVVLMQDRTNLTPELLQRMRRELVELLSKYVEMDKDALELNFDQEGDQMALMLSIPVIRAKDEKEIEEALKAEDEAEESDEDLESEEDDDSEEEKEEETSSEDEENDSEDNQENSDEVEISEEKSEEINNEEQEQNQE
ncbi:TPA: cell division topological specificity factor MinE [Candidatus Gastranaerophilales bacterium HUM_1]|nr:MAG TPA: cell division topological specificity factor MinE [Candidatus Gastranaerophilales bacterium HUM_1]